MGLRSLEELTRLPLPISEIIVLIIVVDSDSDFERSYSNLATDWPSAAHAGSYMRVTSFESVPVSRNTLYHELAHYYFHDFPTWFLEGGAEFAANYVRHHGGGGSLAEWRADVDGIEDTSCFDGSQNIYELGHPGLSYTAKPNAGCFYAMGQHFLSSLFLALGQDVASEALKEILLFTRSVNRGLLTPKDIYLAFRKNLTAGQEAEFEGLFSRLHGGPLTESRLELSYDHSNVSSAATPMTLEASIEGALGDPFDTDYFRFAAEAGQDYHLIVHHEIFNDYVGADLRVRLHHPDNGPPEWLRTIGGGQEGMEVSWEASTSGVHHLSLDSSYGTTGRYTMYMGAREGGPDDHGDDRENATNIEPGQAFAGRMDRPTDLDYFRAQTVEGWGYVVKVENLTLDYSKINLHHPNGERLALDTYGWGFDGAEIQFIAAGSGEYYLAVESPPGNIGEYSITVTQLIPNMDDHADNPSGATLVELAQVVQGTLDSELDLDYFRYEAIGGETYNIRLNHLTVTFQPVTVFATDGVTPAHEYWPNDRQVTGSFFPWVAPQSGEYYLLFHSPDGDTGEYTLEIIPGVLGNDDHGDIPAAATDLPVGQGLAGTLDHADDFDYFRFPAVVGQRYEIAVNYQSAHFQADIYNQLPDTRLTLFGRDGVTPDTRYVDNGRREGGKYIEWEAPASGHYYVVLWSPTISPATTL